jgi:hypothetical protein
MSRRPIEQGLWLVTIVATAVGIVTLRAGGSLAMATSSASQLPAAAVAPERAAPESLEVAVGDIADRNLFRPERASAEEREATARPPVPGAIAPTPRPRLVLRGVLGGPPWDAVIEGIPGREGAIVVRAGQSISGITVRSVHRDTVHVRGFDTTWALTLRTW